VVVRSNSAARVGKTDVRPVLVAGTVVVVTGVGVDDDFSYDHGDYDNAYDESRD